MSNNDKPLGGFYDHLTGEFTIRELTEQEIAALTAPEEPHEPPKP